jgi:plasmid stability protein
MATIIIHDVSDEMYCVISAMAAQHGCSIGTEAHNILESSIKPRMRDILESSVKPLDQVKLGSVLAELGQKVGLTDEEFAIFESAFEETPTYAVSS